MRWSSPSLLSLSLWTNDLALCALVVAFQVEMVIFHLAIKEAPSNITISFFWRESSY